jgi:hypothetical protein
LPYLTRAAGQRVRRAAANKSLARVIASSWFWRAARRRAKARRDRRTPSGLIAYANYECAFLLCGADNAARLIRGILSGRSTEVLRSEARVQDFWIVERYGERFLTGFDDPWLWEWWPDESLIGIYESSAEHMGGGKTHSMLALGYLAANPKLFSLVAKDITQGIKAESTQVVAISGRSISRDKHLWGDVADQLGKADKFLDFYKGAPVAPNEKDWVDLIGDTPTLILLDELPPYFRNAITRTSAAARWPT